MCFTGCVDLSVLIKELDSALCSAGHSDYILEGVYCFSYNGDFLVLCMHNTYNYNTI